MGLVKQKRSENEQDDVPDKAKSTPQEGRPRLPREEYAVLGERIGEICRMMDSDKSSTTLQIHDPLVRLLGVYGGFPDDFSRILDDHDFPNKAMACLLDSESSIHVQAESFRALFKLLIGPR